MFHEGVHGQGWGGGGVPLYSDTVMTHFRIHCLQNWIFEKFSHSIVLGELLGLPRLLIDLDLFKNYEFALLFSWTLKMLVLAHTVTHIHNLILF